METSETLTHPVLQAEAQRARALCTRDLAILATLLHSDLRYVHATGLVHDRAAYLAYAAQGPQFESVRVVEHRLLDWGDTVLLIGRLQLSFTRPGETAPQSASSWISQVWHLGAAGWQLVSLQSTREATP